MATILITHDLGLGRPRWLSPRLVCDGARAALVEEAEPKTLFHAPQHTLQPRRLVAASPTAKFPDRRPGDGRGEGGGPLRRRSAPRTAACAGHAAAARSAEETRESVSIRGPRRVADFFR